MIRRVSDRTGLSFAPNVRERVERRVRDAMAERSARTFEEYLSQLDSDPGAFAALAGALTIGETYFFREPAQFEYIRTHVLPELTRARTAGESLRAWSAGCAAGEEAYSLAILFHELGLGDSVQVIGTDLSEERVALARQAVYSRWSLRGLPAAVEQRWFHRSGSRYHLDPEIRDSVRFHPLNLADGSYPSPRSGIHAMDLILCRNVLIYFDRATVARVAERLMASLGEDGWLFLGASDPPLMDLVPCEVVVTGAGIAYRRPRAHPRVPSRPPEAGSVSPAIQQAHPPARALPSVGSSAVAPPDTSRPPDDAALARSRYAARDHAGSAECAARAIERNGDDPALWALLVRSLANQGRMGDAARQCDAALERHRSVAELHYLHAVILAGTDRQSAAAAAARRALYIDRRLAVAHLLLGDTMRRLGNRREAARSFANAERLLATAGQEAVAAADGQTADRLLRVARLKLSLVGGAG